MADSTTAPARSLTCARCGATFDCGLSAECWCSAEAFRVPMGGDLSEDCLCPDCLRRKASGLATSTQ